MKRMLSLTWNKFFPSLGHLGANWLESYTEDLSILLRLLAATIITARIWIGFGIGLGSR